jgi:hypothetical protein
MKCVGHKSNQSQIFLNISQCIQFILAELYESLLFHYLRLQATMSIDIYVKLDHNVVLNIFTNIS